MTIEHFFAVEGTGEGPSGGFIITYDERRFRASFLPSVRENNVGGKRRFPIINHHKPRGNPPHPGVSGQAQRWDPWPKAGLGRPHSRPAARGAP